MLKKYIQKHLPPRQEFLAKYKLGIWGAWLLNPRLWHFQREDVARALSLGILVGLIPIPGHMVIVPLIIIFILPANLPLAIMSTLITNPATWPPIGYFEYKLGIGILGWPEQPFHFEWSLGWFGKEFAHIWEPMMLGALILAVICAVLSYWLVIGIWRLLVIYSWKNRHRLKS